MISRRRFVWTSAAAAALSCFPSGLASLVRERSPGRLEKRQLGKTGERISVIGFGGIVVRDATSGEAAHRVAEAFDMGVNYYDVAPSYGNAEQMLGPALKPFRNRVFLSNKTQARDARGAREELEDSLRRMQTDHFDLYQLHAVTRVEDVQRIFARNGAMEAFVKAKEEGKIRYIGFSAHSVEASEALMDGFEFDTIMFPINYSTWHAGNFGPQVLEKAKNRGIGILALKAMAKRPWPEGAERRFPKCWYEPFSNREEAAKGLGFTLSHPVATAIPPGDEDLFRMALDLGLAFEPLDDGEIEEMKRLAQEHRPLFVYPSAAA